MASITLKDIPEDVHAQLKAEAEGNLRSLAQEAMIRIQRSFEVCDLVSSALANRLIDEAIASGPAEECSEATLRERFDGVRNKTRRRLAEEGTPR